MSNERLGNWVYRTWFVATFLGAVAFGMNAGEESSNVRIATANAEAFENSGDPVSAQLWSERADRSEVSRNLFLAAAGTEGIVLGALTGILCYRARRQALEEVSPPGNQAAAS
ncbi:MAG: hypothetical protein WBP26_02125 [Candidatus Saccharimonadales bacterium]